MADLKYYFRILISLASGTVLINCGSTGAILYNQNARPEIRNYIAETREWVDTSADGPEVVFHRAGGFQEYAKNVNAKDFHYGTGGKSSRDVAELMDRSFNELAADGIEIDAQTVPANSTYPNVYIVHDSIEGSDLSENARAYLANNTLAKVLTHFIENEYFKSQNDSPAGKYLFIEFKIPKQHLHVNHSPLSEDQKKFVEIAFLSA